MANPADIQHLIGDLAREGVVVSVDPAAGTARVRFNDDLTTGDIPWLASRAGKTRTWSPPSVGEQVAVLAPKADTARGIIIGSLSSDAYPHPANDASTLIEYEDGARIGYDPVAHALTAILPGGATVRIDADGGLSLKGDVTVDGDIRSTGTITADTDVIGAGKSLKDHVHLGVQPGGAVSGKPQ
ncbi:phage baseplate assembly protein V [Sphingomonas ginsenosidivorax]|uniref:Phage baseplate assembly protein V n=1 Tax=Sphingomonas ginsenosidivorax TaxID=862135 RepID=A0A5C6UB90_9SPHN|nr:phage baseplate assembly protein V [Sphingomonas ginsenosidivorax]TXC69780.1 phage baseplate assembly protein V [Sphingomonas ginsenosidivorax]